MSAGTVRPRVRAAHAGLPLRPRAARAAVLLAALVCSACGLVYELALTAVGGALGGDQVTMTSVVLSVMVFAMGVGSLAAKPLGRHPAGAFAVLEVVLGLVGGTSVPLLYEVHARTGDRLPVTVPLTAVAAVLGLLIGAEIPLLMTLQQRVRRQEAADAVADLTAADYTGALAGGLLFPFVLLPCLGQAAAVAVAGTVNTATGTVLVLGVFGRGVPWRRRWGLVGATAGVVVLVAVAAAQARAPARAQPAPKVPPLCTVSPAPTR